MKTAESELKVGELRKKITDEAINLARRANAKSFRIWIYASSILFGTFWTSGVPHICFFGGYFF